MDLTSRIRVSNIAPESIMLSVAMKGTGWPLPVRPLKVPVEPLGLMALRTFLAGRYCQIPDAPP
jgi:hypothetical protein